MVWCTWQGRRAVKRGSREFLVQVLLGLSRYCSPATGSSGVASAVSDGGAGRGKGGESVHDDGDDDQMGRRSTGRLADGRPRTVHLSPPLTSAFGKEMNGSDGRLKRGQTMGAVSERDPSRQVSNLELVDLSTAGVTQLSGRHGGDLFPLGPLNHYRSRQCCPGAVQTQDVSSPAACSFAWRVLCTTLLSVLCSPDSRLASSRLSFLRRTLLARAASISHATSSLSTRNLQHDQSIRSRAFHTHTGGLVPCTSASLHHPHPPTTLARPAWMRAPPFASQQDAGCRCLCLCSRCPT